jgi:hypothetical protein
MSDTAVLRRPGAVAPVITPRDRWHAALDQFNAEQARIEALTAAERSAQENLWAARSALDAAQAELTRVRTVDKPNIVFSFIKGAALDRSNIATAEAAVTKANADIAHSSEVEGACGSELSQAERRLSIRRIDVNETGAAFLTSSPEFAGFLDRLDAAWVNLRTCMILGQELISACRGNCPHSVMLTLQRSEPLADRVGFALDSGFIEDWRRALAQLSAGDPDVQFPRKRTADMSQGEFKLHLAWRSRC